jgi:hypothetical protein
MKLHDSVNITPVNLVTIRVRDAMTGELIRLIKGHNLVCKGSKEAILRLLAQRSDEPNAADYNKVWSIYVGDGTATPAATDTDLDGTNRLGVAVSQNITKDEVNGYVEPTMTLGSGDFNGYDITECGLFTRGDGTLPTTPSADQELLARQVHGAIAKTAAITVQYTWRYQVTT